MLRLRDFLAELFDTVIFRPSTPLIEELGWTTAPVNKTPARNGIVHTERVKRPKSNFIREPRIDVFTFQYHFLDFGQTPRRVGFGFYFILQHSEFFLSNLCGGVPALVG